MDALLSFVESIGNGLNAILDFCISFFEDVAYIVKLTAEYVAKIPSFFSWLPAPVLAIIVSAFAVVVIYKVIGREG